WTRTCSGRSWKRILTPWPIALPRCSCVRRYPVGSQLRSRWSQQPLDRQEREKDNKSSLEQTGIRFVVEADLPAVPALDPVQLILLQTHFVCVVRNAVFEGLVDAAGQGRAVDDEAQFRVQVGGARVEVEGANEDALAVDGEGLGMQARAGTAEGACAGIALQLRGQATHLEQLHSR